MAAGLRFEVEIDENLVDELKRYRNGLQRVVVGTVEKLTDEVEKRSFISVYTSRSMPVQPTGSTYRRTFTLQRGSRKQMVSRAFPNVEGRWWVQGVDYAKDVLGRAQDQDPIHAGRWKTMETYVGEVQSIAAAVIGEEVRKVRL